MDGERNQRVTEVRETSQPVTTTQPVATTRATDGGVIARRVVYYIGGVIIALLALRMIFLLLGANEDSSFVSFIYNLAGIFAAPFYGIFSYEPAYGRSVFEISTLVAIIIYALLTIGIGKLFTLGSRRSDV